MEAFLRGDLAKAKSHYGEILKRDPTQIDLYLRLSEIAEREGKDEEALRWVEKATLIDSRNVTLLLREATLRQKMKQFSGGDPSPQSDHRSRPVQSEGPEMPEGSLSG